jgi:hypothetical protein
MVGPLAERRTLDGITTLRTRFARSRLGSPQRRKGNV